MSEPPLLLVSGGDEYRKRRFIRGLVTKKQQDGWTVYPLVGTAHGELDQVLSTTGVLFPGNALCVVTTPEKLPLNIVKAHSLDTDPCVVLLLVYDTDKPSGPIADLVPKTATKSFTLPAFYKLEDSAVEFAREEAKSRGVSLEHTLALALVKKVGTDYGFLAFEVEKAARLATAQGVKTLGPEIFKGTIAPLSEADGSGILDALGVGNKARLATELSRYKASKGGDPTVELCGRVLTPTALRWFQAAHMSANGVSPQGAAGRLGANPWYWEHKVLPPARALGVVGCKNLLSVISKSQTAVFSGWVNPWGVLESGLLGVLTS